jgi:hypothetical protein
MTLLNPLGTVQYDSHRDSYGAPDLRPDHDVPPSRSRGTGARSLHAFTPHSPG